ncbi:hypothetical protein PSTG_16671 [Puccinia striiformis f. sp. tritici PST-78]|uniref:Uncharacterized protein n=1 Tax=Puccinia striiformis f. sp. tritici PST-78 TaxID=1165861 RepID=A0A0L0US10_9BASI|nr:hypothetical protein PSTG_16671 [Puccinia striiformis f. sp. tritici PST-78]
MHCLRLQVFQVQKDKERRWKVGGGPCVIAGGRCPCPSFEIRLDINICLSQFKLERQSETRKTAERIRHQEEGNQEKLEKDCEENQHGKRENAEDDNKRFAGEYRTAEPTPVK